MALKTFKPPVGPSPGTSFKPTVKVLEAEFGDGFSQPTPDGINNIKDSVELRWDGLTEDEMRKTYDFFFARKGTEAFYYQPAGYREPGKWTCKDFSREIAEGYWKMNATLVQSFTSET